jgi:hypothetical protein
VVKRIVIIGLIILIILAIYLEPVSAENNKKFEKDKDKDGIPDYLDNEEIKKYNGTSNSTSKTMEQMRSSGFNGDNWSANYGSDTTYGAYIKDVYWNSTYYINYANVPWIKIDSQEYEVPNDLTFVEEGYQNYTNYHLVYQMYSKHVDEIDYSIEVLWYFWKTPVSNAGKLNVKVVISAPDPTNHALSARFRFDFDVVDAKNDYFEVYGSESWTTQSTEAYQVIASGGTVDPTWGIKVRQLEYTDTNAWAGIKAWNTLDRNYLLRYHYGEFKGNPNTYLNEEDVYREDDVLWTNATTTGQLPLSCGPTAYLH